MKIHYNEEFNCFETTECHKIDNIKLDGVQLIPITKLEKIKEEIHSEIYQGSYFNNSGLKRAVDIIDKRISELKGENNV